MISDFMPVYNFRYVDSEEIASGNVDAADMVLAAIIVFQGGKGIPRWKRHSIMEKDVSNTQRDAEYCIFDRHGDGSYSLSIKMLGSRKRKPIHRFV